MNLDRIGKYRIVGKIGKGAMGEVYKAHDPLLNRYVAIKTIAPALAAEPDFRRRFQREAQSAAQLNHPNIITVFDFGDEGGLTYMAMELLEGRDLKDVIRARSTHLGEKLTIMERLCDGLAFAHAKGVVHRDLKPGNIHLQPNGQVKILDFGLARLGGGSDMTKTGTVMGTPHYMSPEQVRGQKADARSDVFSLGAVFYELLSQHRPFDADSVHGVLSQILEQEPEPIRRWAPEVPAALVEVVERALTKDPAGRFADAGEMARALAVARDEIAGETIVGASATLATLFQTGDATLIEPAPPASAHGSVRGATALTPARASTRAGQSAHRTVRPDPTVAGGPATHVPVRSGPSRALLIGGAAVAVAAVAGGLVWMRVRARPPALPTAEVTHEQVGILTDALVTSQVELARADLANRDYEAAARRAQDVLKLSAASADAREVLEQAQEAQRKLEAAVTEARSALGRGDVAAASDALGRVMALDPRHPLVGELSSQLNQYSRRQAEDGRQKAEGARRAAEQAQAASAAAFAEGRKLSADAQELFRRQEFAVAAQRYLQSRDAFERAKRETEEARIAAARPAPSARPPLAIAPSPAGLAQTSPTATVPTLGAFPTSTPIPAPTVAAAPTTAPTVAPLSSPTASLPLPAATRADTADAAVRRVIAEYGRAIESQDIGLYRSLKPDLSADDEKRLREAFKAIKSQVVGMMVASVEVDGDRAMVRVTRQDLVNGRPMKPTPQVFRLVRSGGSWLIQSIGQ